jgi:hypothetical protein
MKLSYRRKTRARPVDAGARHHARRKARGLANSVSGADGGASDGRFATESSKSVPILSTAMIRTLARLFSGTLLPQACRVLGGLLIGSPFLAPAHAQAAAAPPPAAPAAVLQPSGNVLFIGNSYLFGSGSPLRYYRANTVTDLNGTGFGGVPAVFKLLANQSGL